MPDTPAQTSITLDFKHDTLRIHKATLDYLGNPGHILLFGNPDKIALFVLRDDGSDCDSIDVAPYMRGKSVELRSSLYMQRWLSWNDALKGDRTYRIYGKKSEIQDVVQFNLAEAVELAKWVPV